MMKQMIILLFLTGILPLVFSVGRNYYLIQQGKSWMDAKTFCRATYTDLATITSPADMVKLQTEALRQQFSSDAWFGLYRSGGWAWFIKTNFRSIIFFNWGPGEPANVSGPSDLCGVTDTNGYWYVKPCPQTFPFVCVNDTNPNNLIYSYFPQLLPWSKARDYCISLNFNLAHPGNSAQASAVARLVSNYTWTGLFKFMLWRWVDTNKQAFVSWNPGQPDNLLFNEDCGYLSNFNPYDARCTDIKAFFCQDVTKDRILRLTVQSNDDMNDPAVQDGIFQKIQQMMQKGIPTFRVRWRKMRDGKVFHKTV